MLHPANQLIRKRSVSVASRLFMIAFALAGCDGPSAAGPPKPPGPTPCAAGELTLADGSCKPIGLPLDMPCPPGELLLDDGQTCQKAGLPPDMPCPPGELLLDNGTCQKAGVPASACGVGFLPDGKDGCEPILPDNPCPQGQMAIPGETACREVAPCGSGAWGDIPVEANTQFVDKSYAGGNSDGTQAKPWTTIQSGVTAAANGAIVAVAAGSYPEDVLIQGKAVRLWGRCPALVEVVGTGAKLAAIQVLQKAANGAEIHSIAVIGANLGIGVSGASDVAIESVWIHGSGQPGLNAQDDLGLTSVALRGSLVEQNHLAGVFVAGSELTVEATVVRSTLPNAAGGGGRGVNIQSGSKATVRASLVEENRDVGVYVGGSEVTLEAAVVRSTQPKATGTGGRGISVENDPKTNARADVTVRACLIEKNHERGVAVRGSDATIEDTVVRSTQPDATGEFGRGISIHSDPDKNTRAGVTVRACLVEENHEHGVFVVGSDALIEATVVRSTLYDPLVEPGAGIGVQDDPDTDQRTKVTVRACLIEQNHDVGVFVAGSDATIEATAVRANLPNALGESGRGIVVQDDLVTFERADVTVRACLVEENHDLGMLVAGSDATIEATVVRSTLPSAKEESGGGLNVQMNPGSKARANVIVRACLFEQNHASGVFVAGSDATLEAAVIRGTLTDGLGEFGRGIGVQGDPETGARANVIVHACLIEQNHEMGVFVMGSDASIEATVVRATQPNDAGQFGRGISVRTGDETQERGNATIRSCLVEQNHDIGVHVAGSDATIVDTAVRDTAPQESDAKFGDGIAVFAAAVTLQDVEVTRNARAGVASFGGQVVITGGVITCNSVDLEGAPNIDIPSSFDGSTGWQCSDEAAAACTELGECHVETNGIEAPSDLPPADPLPL